jgi:thiol-disulfide isomerase/thioredoxin
MKSFYRSIVLAGIFALMPLATNPASGQELSLGTSMPGADRSVVLVDGTETTLAALAGTRATVLVFWSEQCPWADQYFERVHELSTAYRARGVNFVFVNSSERDERTDLRRRIAERPYGSYVTDTTADLAVALGAVRAPQVFVFSTENGLVYSGTIDDSPGDPANVQRAYLREALDATIGGRPVDVGRTKAFGCSIRLPR